jgi:hypothetical protein
MSRKRKNKDNNELNNKKKHNNAVDNVVDNVVDNIDWNEMISASSIRNYMLDDPLIDWLKYYSIDNINKKPNHNNNHNNHNNNYNNNNNHNFNSFIMEQGNIFEKIVFTKLKENLKDNFSIIQVSYNNESQSYEKYMETLKYMKEGVDIIYQGVLHDYNNKLYGVPDLLVRSDKFNSIFNQQIEFSNKKKNYYVVVDIKHSTIHLNCNQEYIKDINSTPAYKGQILIYNKILNNIENNIEHLGFILCKKIIYTKNNITYSNDNFLENIATIDYNNYDNYYVEKVNYAIDWIKRMRTEGNNWSLLPKPSILELYPNMKNDKDDHYRKIKIELADKLNEITNIWWCGYNKRQLAHSKNIFSWKDKKFNAEIIDIKSIKIATTINNILNINRSTSSIIKIDDLIKNNDWRYNNDIMEFYIDFETLNHNIGQVNINDNNDIIFMVCIGWNNYTNNNFWEYQTFMINKNNDDEELNMINRMWEFINNKIKEFNKKDYNFIHWTHAEITFYNKFLSKHPFNNSTQLNKFKSFDLYKLFLDNNIVVKGALNFSLKTVANAMYKNKLITTCWDTSSICCNGLNAMYLAYNLYKNNDYVDSNNNIMKEIIKYNIIDCQVMWEMLSYLRNNY